jgi:hypothetical protein
MFNYLNKNLLVNQINFYSIHKKSPNRGFSWALQGLILKFLQDLFFDMIRHFFFYMIVKL